MKNIIPNKVFYFLKLFTWRPLNFVKNWAKTKSKMIPLWGKNKRKKKQCYHEDICKLNSFSSEVENYKGNCLNNDNKKENFKKDLMNLIEKNHTINTTPDHSNSSSNSFKSFEY